MKVHQLLLELDRIFPLDKALEWDNCGLQVGDPSAEVKKVLITLDITHRTLEEALLKGCNVIISHHPLIFKGLTSIDISTHTGGIITTALKCDISLISLHTNVDAAENGLASYLASLLEMEAMETLTPEGIGVLARCNNITPEEMAERVKRTLNIKVIRVVEGAPKYISKVAICPGSGGDLIDTVIAKEADCYITGDVKYHQAQKAYGRIWVMDAGHYATEKPFCQLMAEILKSIGVRTLIAETQKDCIAYY